MRGFKSFGPRKVVVTLDRGFTVITGPNGSGKSNIMDAVRFVLGELSARSLRADKFAGVIFDGAPGVSKSKSAHVSIQFDNSDRRIPVDTGAVSVSREVKRDGQSIYRLNGRKVPRGQLVDILTVAGLNSHGHNMVMQGTITRLADVTPEERRKIIEELIGIAEYDAKKAEAQTQLQQAEINLRVASARIDEVQKRLESLEKERNDALRYNFIQNEIKRLQAAITSHRITLARSEVDVLTARLKEKMAEAEAIKKQREQLQSKRKGVESERRTFDEEVADKGSVRLVSIQTAIGDISAQIASLKTEIEAGSMSLKGLVKLREERLQQVKALKTNLGESMKTLARLKRERDKLKEQLEERQAKYAETSSKLSEIKQSLEESINKMEKIEEGLEKFRRRIVKLNTTLKGSVAKSRVLVDSLETLDARRTEFESTLQNLSDHFLELQKLQKEEEGSLGKVEESLERSLARKDALITELLEAERTAQRARSAVVEFETQKTFAEKIAAEEKALEKIEEMGEVGAIPGVYGRLKNLIRVSSEYRKAVEAASAGWLRAIVVKDLETALKCVESLKRMKIGRIKLIPLRDVASVKPVEAPEIGGVIGTAASLVRCKERYSPAVNFIFGDTIVTSGEKSALLTAKSGYRAVDLSGDLYDPGGGMESGYYRAPIEISTIIPSESAIENLDKSVKALESMLEKRRVDIEAIEEEIGRLNEEKIRRSDVIRMMVREIGMVEQNISRVRHNIKLINRRIRKLRKSVEKEKNFESVLEAKRTEIMKQVVGLRSERKSIKLQIKPTVVARFESDQTQLGIEVNELQRQLVRIESEVSSLESNLKTTLKPEYNRASIDLRTLDKQISALQERIKGAESSLEGAIKQLSELESAKERLSEALASVKDDRRKFELQLDEIDTQLKKINARYEPVSTEVHRIELDIQTKSSDLRHLEEELHSLGYSDVLVVRAEELRNIESSLSLMRFELEKLGSVNQLAISQYDEQKDNYKQLSVRRNQLEGEKRAILQFMDEIERKKREAFMKAYTQINENFRFFFSKLTGGGEGWLEPQNPEDPFAGGLDIYVQFPGKSARLVAGASGGEKSVAAISFIFAIQSLSPAPFSLLDEIDAHLDPYNAERLADLLKDQSENSQFIIITLRDVVMDRAERLFGVYVQNGVSGIASIKLAEVTA